MKLPRLKDVRERQLMTQRDLAAKAGVSKTTLVRLEAHGMDAELRTVRKLAQALEVAPEELWRS